MTRFAPPHALQATAALLMMSLCVAAQAQDAPPPPSAAQIKECVKQIDIANQWRFDWKALVIGAPRHPRNNYEAMAFLGGPGLRSDYGYPVHVTYSIRGVAEIDSLYWLIRDANGHWEIPAICVMP